MNILNKVTVKSLRLNKTRTVVTIIGIILSAAMIVAVISFILTLQRYMLESVKLSDGDWHVMSLNVTQSDMDSLKQNSKVKDVSFYQNIGYSVLDDSDNDYKPYIYLCGFEQGLVDTLPVSLTAGRLPQNSNEIVLPEHLSTNGGISFKVGDKLTLNIGNRKLDGETLWQDTSLITDENNNTLESFSANSSKTYTVVGIIARPNFEDYSAPGYTAITLYDENVLSDSYNCYIHLNDPKDSLDFVENELAGGKTNSDLLMYMGISGNNAFNSLLYSFGAILILLIMFGSIALIYNAFSISVSERTKQFGLLSSIGATKRQLKKTVLFEALYVSLIGIPLGIIFGIAGASITIHFLSPMLSSFIYSSVQSHPQTKLVVSFVSILASIIISLITVLISAYIPALRASRKSAIDAIRQSDDIKLTRKNVKTSKLTYKLFGLEGMIASKNFKRNKKKYRSTVISISMSIVLFISAFSFTSYINASFSDAADIKDVDILYQSDEFADYNQSDNLYEQLKTAKDVTESDRVMLALNYNFTADYSLLTDEFIAENDNPVDEQNSLCYPYLCFVEENQFESLYDQYGADTNSNAVTALAINKFKYRDENSRYRNSEIFKESLPLTLNLNNISSDTSDDVKVEITGFVNDENLPMSLNRLVEHSPVIILPESSMTNFDSEFITEFCFKSSSSNQTYNDIKVKLIASGNSYQTLIDYKAGIQSTVNFAIVINVFSYGFIVLISLIAVANIFNTISTNVRLRRKEFAMLKSVGLTRRGFNKMMNYECLLYGLKSLIIGLPLAILAAFLIYLSAMQGVQVRFTLPYQAILISVICVFIVVFTTMIYAMNKIKKENTIDALKSDTL